MTNIRVEVQGTARLGPMSKEFAALQAQVAGLNAQLSKMMDHSQPVDARGYDRLAKAAALNSSEFRKAAASTGMFEVQQVRLNSATDEYVKKLNAQKTSFRELMRTRKIAHAAFREQLAMESMLVKKAPSGTTTNKEVFDVVTPKRYDEAVNTAGRRLSWFNAQLQSGANQMVNWGKNTQWAGRQLMVGFTIPLAAFGAAAGVMAYRLDEEMTRVRKVYDTTADSTSGDMKDIMAVNKELAQVTEAATQTAIMSAKAYGQAAVDTIGVQAELAATGKTGLELQRNTLEVMRIARLGEVDYQTATEATIALQSIYRMSNEELTESFNYMNAVENATSLATKDFAAAIPIAGSAVKAWGGDIKELGVLLTAMKENGIDANEGANAIKATMQRLARPSKQIREEFLAITGVNILDITDNATGLVDVFTQINDVTKDLSESDRRKAFAGLFGSYQVSRMMALTKGMGELEEGVGQVSDAYAIAGKAPEEWRQIAENELRQYQESISGRFKSTLENLKIQLAEVGEPFVQAATVALQAIAGILEAFNNAPSAVKWFVAIAAVVAALAGPVVMLTGLFANLFGNGLKMLGFTLTQFNKLLGVMGVLPREARINALAAELMEKGYTSQAKAVRGLTAELEKLVAAQAAANKSSAKMVADTSNIRKSKALIAREAREAEHARLTGIMNTNYGVLGVDKKIYYKDPITGKSLSNAAVLLRAKQDMAAEDAKIAAASQKTAVATAQTKRNLTGAAVAGGALAAGMVLTMASSNETANEIGNMLILGSLVVPAAIELTKVLAMGLKYVKWTYAAQLGQLAVTKAQVIAQTAYYRTSIGISKAQLAWNSAAGRGVGILGRMGAVLTTFASPLTLAVGAVAAVGVGIWAWKRHLDKVREAQTKLHTNINGMVDAWAEKVGLVRKEYERIAGIQRGIAKEDKYQSYLDAYNSGDMKERREAFGSDEITDSQRITMARAQFARMIRDYGMSMEDASLSLQAMYESAGMSIFDAQKVVSDLADEFGSELSGIEQMQIQAELVVSPGQTEETARANVAEFARAFSQAFTEADPGAETQALLDYFQQIMDLSWNKAWENLNNSDEEATKAMVEGLKEMGIDSAQALREGIESAGGVNEFINQMFPTLGPSQFADVLAMEVDPAIANTATLMSALAKTDTLGFITDDVTNIKELTNTVEGLRVVAQGFNADEARKYLQILANPVRPEVFQNISGGLTDIERAMYTVSDEQRIQYANAILTAQGYKQINTEAELLAFLAGDLPPKISRAASAARGLAAAFRMSNAELGEMGQNAMQATQQAFVDDYSDYMSDRYDAELEAEQNHWDQRVENVTNAGERARAGLDAAWERKNDAAEKYWDHRIELVDKAIEAEQKAEEQREKMFDAEIARIQKLNDMANANIDFNVALNEGKLDEAAKLRNDLEAQTTSQAMERARDQMSNQSEKRINKLTNRKDRLEEQRDRVMEAMQKQEAAQKASLDRQVEAQREAVEAQRDAAIEAKEAEIEAAKEADQKSIENLMAVTSKSKAELFKRMRDAGINYKDFYRDVIKPTGDSWGKYFDRTLQENLRRSAAEIADAAYWEEMGAKEVEKMARGMGFSGKRGLMHFLKTGEIKDFHEDTPAGTKTPDTGGHGPGDKDIPEGRHQGGEIGSGPGSRKGVARTYKGIHPSETMVLAQKGEFMLTKDAYAKNPELAQAMNSGEYDRVNKIKNGRGGGAPGQGPAPFFAAAFTRAMALKTADALKGAVQTKQAQQAAMAAAYASGTGSFGTLGHYSLPGVKPWVLEAANYLGGKYGITSIGGVGERSSNPTSDHPKGLALDFMTYDQVTKGWALANEALRLQRVLDATYMIFQGKIHSFDSRGWMPYSHPSGATDPTSMHMDHVHLSFSAAGKAGDLPKPAGATLGPGIAPGVGGLARASAPGKGWSNSHDYQNGLRSPIYAIADGNVTSRSFGPTSGSGQHPNAYPKGYGSYGVQAILRANNGATVSAAHLWPGSVVTGPVKAGQQIALSASTGNSSGPHTHFEVNGSTNAQGAFAAMGIPLRKGAAEVRFNNTLANLHHGERVLTEDLTSKMNRGMTEYFANGGRDEYTVIVNPSEGMDEERLANKVVKKLDRRSRRRPVTRTVGIR